MRYYIDTNIFLFLNNEDDSLHADVKELLNNYENTFYISSICIIELIHLFQTEKIKGKWKSALDIVTTIQDLEIKIIPLKDSHLKTFALLPIIENHKDPNDRIIIAQAITDKIPLISSDTKFKLYKKYNLSFIYNKR